MKFVKCAASQHDSGIWPKNLFLILQGTWAELPSLIRSSSSPIVCTVYPAAFCLKFSKLSSKIHLQKNEFDPISLTLSEHRISWSVAGPGRSTNHVWSNHLPNHRALRYSQFALFEWLKSKLNWPWGVTHSYNDSLAILGNSFCRLFTHSLCFILCMELGNTVLGYLFRGSTATFRSLIAINVLKFNVLSEHVLKSNSP